MITDAPLLRFMVLSAIIGFFVFCASYTILVWKKRRQSSDAPRSSMNRLRGWSITAIVLGCLGVMSVVVVRETVRADGMLGGEGLFAVRSTPEMRVEQLAEEGPVKKGDLLAKFDSPKIQAEIGHDELSRELLKIEQKNHLLQTPQLDQEKSRRREQASNEMRQLEANLIAVLPSREGADRENIQHRNTQRDMLGKIDHDLAVNVGELKMAQSKLTIAKKQLERELKLVESRNVPTNELNERQKEVGSLEAEIAKLEKTLTNTEERRRICKESLEQIEKNAIDSNSRMNEVLKRTTYELDRAKGERAQLDLELADDAKIARERHDQENKAFDIKIKQAEESILAKQNLIEVRSRHDGMVVYRSTSPGAALNQGPVLVFGPAEPMRFRFLLPNEQIKALQEAGTVNVELDSTENSIEQRFPGKFLSSTPLTRDPGNSMVELEIQPPPATVASLAEGKPIKARFSWRPPLMNLWPFPVSLAFIAIGILGLIVVNLGQWKPNWPAKHKSGSTPDDDDAIVSFVRVPAPKEGDTTEAVASDTISVRPELPTVPRERPVQPWEHPVGVRLREAIVREDVSTELLSAVEMAIEHQQDAIIVPMREALRRVPSVPEHARGLLDKLNSSETQDELKMIEHRCLAQRLTFLLYTLGFEIPSHVGLTKRPPSGAAIRI